MYINGEYMRIWTIQPVKVLDIINKQGYFICDIKQSSFYKDACFIKAYDWLYKRMCEKIGTPPKGVTYPIWAWYMREGKNKKPDLRESGYQKRGTNCVCIELEIDSSRVVLSDFDDWHFVLNNWFLFYPLNEKEYERGTIYFENLSIEEQEKIKEKSWESIFSLKQIDNDWSRRGYNIQATFWVLYKEDIKSIKRFKAR